MEILISLSSEPSDSLTEQAKVANERAEKRRLEQTYGDEDLSPKEIDKKEEERLEQEEQKLQDDPNRLPETAPPELGKTKIGEEESATSITNRHDNLPQSKI